MKRRILFSVISIFIGLFVSIAGLEILFRILPVNEGIHRLSVNDNNPVIRTKENRDFTFSTGWNFSNIVTKHSNNYGFLNDHDYFKDETTPLMAII